MIAAWVVATLLAAGGPADPGGSNALSELFSRFQSTLAVGGPAKVGEWVTYQVHGDTSRAYFRLAFLGEDKLADGTAARWFELAWGNTPDSAILAAKFLSSGFPGERRHVLRSVVRIAGGQAQELTPRQLRDFQHEPSQPALAIEGAQQTPERKTVAAGTFDCMRLDFQEGRLWVSSTAPMFHLVAGELVGGNVFELYDSGTHAADWVGNPEALRRALPDGGVTYEQLDGGRP